MYCSKERNDCYALAATRVLLSSAHLRSVLKRQWTCQEPTACVIAALGAIVVERERSPAQEIRVDELLEDSRRQFSHFTKGTEQCSLEFLSQIVNACGKCAARHHSAQESAELAQLGLQVLWDVSNTVLPMVSP